MRRNIKRSFRVMAAVMACILIAQLFVGINFASPQLPDWLDKEVRSGLNKDTGEITQNDLDSIKTLDISGKNIVDISTVSQLSNLVTLNISGNGVLDLSPVSSLSKLEVLIANNNLINSLEPLKNLTSLKKLSLTKNDLSDIKPLENLQKLTSLFLKDNDKIIDFSPTNVYYPNLTEKDFIYLPPWLEEQVRLELNKETGDITSSDLDDVKSLGFNTSDLDLRYLWQFKNIEALYLSDCGLSDISPLAKFDKIESLTLTNNKISDISAVSNMKELKELYIIDNNLSDLSPLSNLNKLEEIYMSGNSVSNIGPLANLSNLNSLYAENNKIENISAISGLNKIEHLDLSNNKINDFSPISKLSNLHELSLNRTGLTDLGFLAGLTGLTDLRVCENKINNITPVSGLINLNILFLAGNQIKDITPLGQLNNLGMLYLLNGYNESNEMVYYGNPIEDFSPITQKEINDIDIHPSEFYINIFGPDESTKVVENTPLLIRVQGAGMKSKNINITMTDPNGKDTLIGTKSENDFTLSVTFPTSGEYTLKAQLSENPQNIVVNSSEVKVNVDKQTGVSTPTGIVSTQTVTPTPTGSSQTATPTPTTTPTSTVKPTVVVEEGKKTPGSGAAFTDINKHWAKEFILDLVDKNIITGYKNGTFKPNKYVTRQELAVIIVKALGLKPIDGNTGFKDDNRIPAWAKGYVKAALENDIINGYKDGKFKGPNQCSRQEIIVVISKAFELGAMDGNLNFKDSKKIGSWAKDYIVNAVDLEIIKGYKDNTFLPKKSVTRAEACKMIYNAMNV
ncbi:MAG: S-layer homology domain-containing protein [Bacillota bacterium]|nr:S-layer homology domain-containing protein [Bacillota bacterium]